MRLRHETVSCYVLGLHCFLFHHFAVQCCPPVIVLSILISSTSYETMLWVVLGFVLSTLVLVGLSECVGPLEKE